MVAKKQKTDIGTRKVFLVSTGTNSENWYGRQNQ